jgi:hypothetical protein
LEGGGCVSKNGMFVPIGIPFFNVHPHFFYFCVGNGFMLGSIKNSGNQSDSLKKNY